MPRPTDPPIEYHFTDAARVAIVQARSEALFAKADAVAPKHLALGVIHSLTLPLFNLLFPDRGNFDILCRALGGSSRPAPVIPEHIDYRLSSREALDSATRLARDSPMGPDTHPLHILLGILRPWSVEQSQTAEPDQTALDLAATGLSETRLRELLPAFLTHST